MVAILAFGLMQTVVNAWYAGSDMASAQRLVSRNATSLVFPLPVYYRDRIRAVEGVTAVSTSNWFGGIYKDMTPANFFAQFAVDHENFFDLYPEFRTNPEELLAFKRDRRGAMVGRLLADAHGFKVGDVIPVKGTIYPGTWEFVVRGIYEPKDDDHDHAPALLPLGLPQRADQEVLSPPRRAGGRLHHPDRRRLPRGGDQPGRSTGSSAIRSPRRSPRRRRRFQLSFIAQTETIVMAVRIVSFVVIVIIFAVVANTMAMTARERLAEYATLKALGFGPGFVAALIVGESAHDHGAGRRARHPRHLPRGRGHSRRRSARFFPVFKVAPETVAMQAASALAVGLLAGILPSIRAARVKIVDGLRYIG